MPLGKKKKKKVSECKTLHYSGYRVACFYHQARNRDSHMADCSLFKAGHLVRLNALLSIYSVVFKVAKKV